MWKNILSKLTNTRVIISIVSTVVLVLISLGVKINSTQILAAVESACTLGILLGVFNNSGMSTTSWNDRNTKERPH